MNRGGGCFFYSRCIVSQSVLRFTATEGLLLWKENWVTFLDSMLQLQVFTTHGRDLRLSTRIRSLRIDPVAHETLVSTLDDGSKGMVAMVLFRILIVPNQIRMCVIRDHRQLIFCSLR